VKFISKLTNESVVCSELKVKDYKEILKCTLGDEPDQNIFIETICEVLERTTNKTADFFKNLSVIDLFILLLDLRINSQGDVCKVVVTKDEKQMNLELQLEDLKKEMLEFSKQALNSEIEQDNLKIIFSSPSSTRLLETTEEEYLYFIKEVYFKKLNKRILVETNEQARLLFDVLVPKTSLKIIEQFNETIKKFSEYNFLKKYKGVEQKLSFLPSLSSLIWFTKLLFNEPLEALYNNIFYLAHLGHIDANYIENCSSGEYLLFTKILERTLNSRSTEPASQDSFDDDPENFDDGGIFEE